MFDWEPERHWFSTEHHQTALTPFWLSKFCWQEKNDIKMWETKLMKVWTKNWERNRIDYLNRTLTARSLATCTCSSDREEIFEIYKRLKNKHLVLICLKALIFNFNKFPVFYFLFHFQWDFVGCHVCMKHFISFISQSHVSFICMYFASVIILLFWLKYFGIGCLFASARHT